MRFLFLTFFLLFLWVHAKYANGLSSSTCTNLEKLPALQIKIANMQAKEERRAKDRELNSSPRKICDGCGRPPILCLCKALPEKKLQTNTTILILQHPNEFRKKTFSTVPLIPLMLENVHIKIGYRFSLQDLPIVEDFLLCGNRPLLLFPSEKAFNLDHLHTLPKVKTKKSMNMSIYENPSVASENLLILLDGTWAEAKRMASKSTELMVKCQLVTFSAEEPSRYHAVRKEPERDYFSTLEACAHALVRLEHRYEASRCLTNLLDLMIETKLGIDSMRKDDPNQKGRTKRLSRMIRRERVEKGIFQKPESRSIDESGAVLLRPLTVQDAEIVNKNWYHPSQKSLRTIEKRILNGLGCFGIEYDGKLRAHIVRCEDGCLGMLYVDQEVRRRGYGRVLVKQAAAALDTAGLPQMALIKNGNTAAESLFRSIGWALAGDKLIKHEGRHRRRWVPSNNNQ